MSCPLWKSDEPYYLEVHWRIQKLYGFLRRNLKKCNILLSVMFWD